MRFWAGILMFCVLVLLVLTAVPAYAGDGAVSKGEFSQAKIGQTRGHVQSIWGTQGVKTQQFTLFTVKHQRRQYHADGSADTKVVAWYRKPSGFAYWHLASKQWCERQPLRNWVCSDHPH